MQNFYLQRWLKEYSGLDPVLLDALKFELDKRIYYYGAQFAHPAERSRAGERLGRFKSLLKSAALNLSPGGAATGAWGAGPRLCSNAYFGLNPELERQGFAVKPPPWRQGLRALGDADLYALLTKVKCSLETAEFRELLSPEFIGAAAAVRAGLKKYFQSNEVAALVVPFDLPFFERLALGVFRELGRPSFVALHGLPGRYNALDDNRADYLLVWGERIKANYVRAGIPEEKIFVSGHPGYRSLPSAGRPASLENVLVISKSMGGAQHSAEEVLTDRGNLPLYLYSVRRALLRRGVKGARLRLHPSESRAWYAKFLDGDFFTFDSAPLGSSLALASLVIGPTSTVFVEALLASAAYLVYEPAADGRDLVNYPLVPPFDGSEAGVPAAHDEAALERMLETPAGAGPEALKGYIKTPFDISFLKGLVQGASQGRPRL